MLVNVYRIYFGVKKGIVIRQPSHVSKQWISIINNRYSIHAAIAFIAIVTLFTNVTTTQAENYIEKTTISLFVTPEFGEGGLIIETAAQTENGTDSSKPIQYIRVGYVSKSASPAASLSEEEILQENVLGSVSQGGSVLIKQNVATTDIDRKERIKTVSYTVQPGDTVTSIAHTFDVSINTVLWENNLTAYSIIRPGKELVILPSTGLTHTIKKNDSIAKLAGTYQVEPESISEANLLLADASLTIGQKLFIPNGLKPRPTPTVQYLPTPRSGSVSAPRYGGEYIWPTSSYHITQYYTYRHFGLDIGSSREAPIYASADGEVIESSQGKWNGGYGNQIVIDHGGGIKTRYAHNNYNVVSVGTQVKQGQQIAVVGSTGRSSGPHIHFEIMIDNRRVNPLNYLAR